MEINEFVNNYSLEGDARLVHWPCPNSKVTTVPVYDRPYEYAYVVEKLVQWKLNNKNILDVGSTGSVLPGILVALGHRVTCIDVREWPIQIPNLRTLKRDVLESDPLSNFDIVTCISALEHFGLGRYGDKQDVDGDLKGMERISQYLKPKGHMILTVPFGVATVAYPAHRIYNADRFNRLLKGFNVLDMKFFGPIDRVDAFRPCSEAETYSIDTDGHYAIVCTLLEKR